MCIPLISPDTVLARPVYMEGMEGERLEEEELVDPFTLMQQVCR